MGEGTCKIDRGRDFVYAVSATDCLFMNKKSCNLQQGGGCYWNDETDQCEFGDGLTYADAYYFVVIPKKLILLGNKMKNNLALTLSIVGVVVVVIAAIIVTVVVIKKNKSKE